MIHYHGTPITPNQVLETLAGRHFCVSFSRPEQVRRCHDIGQSVMLDNGTRYNARAFGQGSVRRNCSNKLDTRSVIVYSGH